MILVTGATGHLGRAALDHLRKELPLQRIAALARDVTRASELAAEGIQVRQGDYADYRSLVSAFADIEKLLLVSSSALEGVAEQHVNAIRAAAQAGVKHIVYTSMTSLPATSRVRLINEYKATEEELMASGLTYTILRNGYYFDMLPMFIGDAPRSGRIRYPAGDGRASYALRADLAEAAARALLGSEHEDRVYELNTNDSHSFQDIAALLSELTGKAIEYVDIPLEVMAAELRDQQMSQLEVELMMGIAASIRYSEADRPSADLEALLLRTPVGLEDFLRQTYSSQIAVDSR
jgi:NAD(P)H dehydrogenase (quinone)